MASLRSASAAIVISVAACSGGGMLSGVGGTTGGVMTGGAGGSGSPSGASGAGAGWECQGAAGCGNGVPFMCPAIVSEPNYACPSGSTAIGCALPSQTTLVQSANNGVYLAASKTLFEVSATGLAPRMVFSDATSPASDGALLIDEPNVYYFSEGPMSSLQVLRSRIDGSDAPTVYWGCAATTPGAGWFAKMVPDGDAFYIRTAMGTYRIDKAATPPAQASWAWDPVTIGALAADDQSVYFTSYADGIRIVDKNSSCPCTCEAPVLPLSTGAGGSGSQDGLRCPGLSGVGGQGGAGGGIGVTGGTGGGVAGAGGTTGTGGVGGALPSRPCAPSFTIVLHPPDISLNLRPWLHLDGDAMWFADYEVLYRARKDGSNVEKILGPGSPNPSLRTGPITAQGPYLYLVAPNGTTNSLVRIERSTRAVTTLVANAPPNVSQIALTSDAVYLLRWIPAAANPYRSCESELLRYPLPAN